MVRKNMVLKSLFIVVLVVAISTVHWLSTGSDMGYHTLHQQLFFIPLVLASFWFGSRVGLLTAVAVSVVYGPVMLSRHQGASQLLVFTQVALYLFVALLMGWLSDRQRRQHQLLIINERITALGKAAATLGVEIWDIVKEVESIYRYSGGLKNGKANNDFFTEMNRLRKVVDSLKNFNPSFDQSFSTDLNDILRLSFEKYRREAADKGLKIVVIANPTECPSQVPKESLSRIFDALVSNAIDFSGPGQAIILRAFAGEKEEWVLEVADSGPGVATEDKEKLFTAFFTTKPDGYGLSLSSGRKVLRDFGGDLVYETGDNGGAVFRMHIPHEYEEKRNERVLSTI